MTPLPIVKFVNVERGYHIYLYFKKIIEGNVFYLDKDTVDLVECNNIVAEYRPGIGRLLKSSGDICNLMGSIQYRKS